MKATYRDNRIICLFALLLTLALLSGCGAPAAEAPDPAGATAAQETTEPPAETAAVPPLQAHTVFLFPDEDGFLRPDEALTEEELQQALDALQPDKEAAASLNKAADGETSRRDFARRVAELLGWTAEERLRPAADAAVPLDLDPRDIDFTLLLEASVPHQADGQGSTWAETVLAAGREPGPFLRGTALYCCGEDGFLLRDTALGPLSFGPDGRYSSGDAELDGYVTGVIAALQEQYPEDAADRFALLRHSYDYVRDSFGYLGRRHIIEAGTDWHAEDAKTIFSSGKGNCYNYAAAFRFLARQLGYPAYNVLRSLDAPENIHAWTDIVFDGVPYIFDPQLESVYKNNRFMIDYQSAQQVGHYTRPEQAELEAEG